MRGRGGHGHNDITSFELFLDGLNVITDCGSYLYTASREWRNLFRSTAFHNLVQIDNEELNRFIGPDALWQLKYDAHPRDLAFAGGQGGYFRGGHDGYQRLSPSVWPVREFWMHPEQPIVALCDRVDGFGAAAVIWRFHFDPALTVELVDGDCRVRGEGHEAWMLFAGDAPGQRELKPGWVSPGYGVRSETHVLVVRDATLPTDLRCVFATSRLSTAEREGALAELDAHRARTHLRKQ
jgi:hypothetical protein